MMGGSSLINDNNNNNNEIRLEHSTKRVFWVNYGRYYHFIEKWEEMVKDNSSPFDLRVSNEIGRFSAVLSLIIHVWIIRLLATPQLLNISTSLLSKIKREERMFFYTVLFRCRKKLEAKEKQLPAEKTNTSYNFCIRGFSGLEGRQKLCTLWPSLLQPGGSWPSGVEEMAREATLLRGQRLATGRQKQVAPRRYRWQESPVVSAHPVDIFSNFRLADSKLLI
jgi:hypothetical protein